MTLMDSVDNFMAKYIRRSSSSIDDIEDDSFDEVLRDGEFSDRLDKFQPKIEGKRLSSQMCRLVALSSPLFCKGVWKKTMDTFRAGFSVVDDQGNTLRAPERVWIDRFNKRNDINKFMFDMKVSTHIYGYAPVYMRFAEEIKKGKNIDHSRAPPEAAEPFKVYLLNPEKVKKFDYKNNYWKQKGVKHLVYEKEMGREIYIHPDRVDMNAEKQLPFSMFGISDVVMLRHILSSNADIDIASGKILKWFSYGVREWKKAGADKDDREHMAKQLAQHPDIITSDKDDYEFKIHTPEAIDPQPFYDHITMSIAGVLVMPTHILTGVRVGRVTGAEAGYSDYYRDINDAQALVYTPFLKRMYQRIYDSHSSTNKTYIFDSNIEWNPTYVNEMAEAELLDKRAQAVEKLLGTQHEPVITVEEARDILKRGAIEFKQQMKEDKKTLKDKSEKGAIKTSLESYHNLLLNDNELSELREQINQQKEQESS